MNKNLFFHFSVDDVIKSLIEITDKKIKIKDHWFFSILYKIHKKYNLKISLYLFYAEKINGKTRYLSEIRNLKKELNGNWLYFGAHSHSYKKPLHSQSIINQKKHINIIYKEIIRFAGKNLLASKVRFHEYSECYEISDLLKKYKIKALFSTDKKIGSHRLNNNHKKKLLLNGKTRFKNLNFIRTDFRVENMIKQNQKTNINNLNNIAKKRNFLSIYTHEYELEKKKIRLKLFNLLDLISKNFLLKSY